MPKIAFRSDVPQKKRNHTGPTSEAIRRRAFEIYVASGETQGHDLDDWLRAERELREEYQHKAANQVRDRGAVLGEIRKGTKK